MSKIDAIPMIERAQLFGNPQRAGAQLSPDGKYLSWLAPDNGVMNIWVASLDQRDQGKVITNEVRRGIGGAWWAFDSIHLLYSRDNDGDENHLLYATNAQTGETRLLTELTGARVNVVAVSRRPALRNKVLVEVYQRDPRYGDLFEVDVTSGAMTLVQENPGFRGYVVNQAFEVVFGIQAHANGSVSYLRKSSEDWSPWLTFAPEDAAGSRISHIDAAGEQVFVLDCRGRDKAALVSIPLSAQSGDQAIASVVAEDAHVDIGGVFIDIASLEPLAVVTNYLQREMRALSPRVSRDFEVLSARFRGEWFVVSRTEDDRLWIIVEMAPTRPGVAFLYHRDTGATEELFVLRPELEGKPLARMQATVIPTRDGLGMVSYLTLPVNADIVDAEVKTRVPVPLVLLVHGGPWSRDSFGFDPTHQWLANRGYAVLAVNFRGSTGFGKAFTAAADGEWGAKMDDDLCDAVDWAVARGIADPARVAIMGGSYGGYATLWALTQHPTRYACGVDIVGPSNLETLLAAIPPYWESFKTMLYRGIGNPETADGLALLKARSPLSFAHQIKVPLLIGQGANDPRVKRAESDQMVTQLQSRGIPYTYVVFPDEGHGFSRPVNTIKFNVITEMFLARHLGGRQQAESENECVGNTALVVDAA